MQFSNLRNFRFFIFILNFGFFVREIKAGKKKKEFKNLPTLKKVTRDR